MPRSVKSIRISQSGRHSHSEIIALIESLAPMPSARQIPAQPATPAPSEPSAQSLSPTPAPAPSSPAAPASIFPAVSPSIPAPASAPVPAPNIIRQPGSQETRKVIEAALFTSPKHLSLEELAKLTGIAATGFVLSEIQKLQKEYEERGSALTIVFEEGKCIMRVKGEYSQKVRQFAQESEISKGALKVLGYVYKSDGLTKSSLVKKLGSTVYQYVAELKENGFVEQKPKGRTSTLHVTQKFKGYFGV